MKSEYLFLTGAIYAAQITPEQSQMIFAYMFFGMSIIKAIIEILIKNKGEK